MKAKTIIYTFGLLCLCLALATPAFAERPYKPVKSASKIKNGDILIVGKIRLDPPLERGEQNLRSRPMSSRDNATVIVPGAKKFMNSFFMLLDTKKGEPTRKDLIESEILVPIDETFFLAGKKRPLYVLSTGIAMTIAQTRDGKSRAFLPSGYKIPVKKGDKAVYIGTIVYKRDEFMRVKSVKVLDEYGSAKKELAQKFGKKFKLRKALIKAR